MRNQINNIERTHSGYDEYRYDLDEINHNPYELAAYLTVKFEDYTREEVQSTLRWLFDQQYELILTEEVEIRTRTETRTGTSTSTDPETGETTTEEYEYEVEVEYEYYILNITQGFSAAFENALPSVYPLDLLVGIVGAVIIRLIVYVKGKNAKKYRKGAEYGSARWSA